MSQSAIQSATYAQGLGLFDQAESLYRSIPIGRPEYADAVMGLAVIAYRRGRPRDAAAHFSRLIALRPGQASHHSNLGECLRECGRLDEALSQLKLGISLDPNQPDALNSLGLVYQGLRRLDEAEDALRRAIQLRPEFPVAMINLGTVLQENRRLKDAADLFRLALKFDPDNPMGNSNLGQILVEIGRTDDLDFAEQCCLKAIRLAPDRPHAINNLGNVYRAMGRFEEAVECYRKAMAIAPGLAMPLNNMGQALQGRARHAEAAEFYMNAIALEPNSARFHANYASLLHEQEQYEQALERYRHAVAVDPGSAEGHHGMGQAYTQLQDTARAEACFRKAIEIDPELTAPRLGLCGLYQELGETEKAEAENAIALTMRPKLVDAYYQLASRRRGKVSDPEFAAMNGLLGEKYLGERGRSQLHFALGIVHDRRSDHEAAGRHFRAANELQVACRMKRGEAYDPAGSADWIDRLIAAFPGELQARLRGAGHPSARPIFVVGLPRSGTTLTEQILASHPAVHGAGELTLVAEGFRKLHELPTLGGEDSFSALKMVGAAEIVASAEAYLRGIAARGGEARFVVDKMPDNINMFGWIRLMFPNARVIHCRRDLRDVALSCWQTCFGAIRWANDWDHIARRFADYLRAVDHWKDRWDADWLEFPYESVVEDTEGWARRLIEYVGLEWEPDCLNFHETRRQVRTASLSQVRSPIYRSSVAKWRNYRREMSPFIDAMERFGWMGPA